MNRHDVECDSCGCREFVVLLANGRYYVECDGCGASLFDTKAQVA